MTAPIWVSNSTKHVVRPTSSIRDVISKYNDCSCALACPAGGASGRAWFFLVLFCIKAKKNRKTFQMIFTYFLLLVQKKVTKKSTAPMMYGHWRRPDWNSVLLLTELNNSNHRHLPKNPKDEKTCFVIHCKPDRRYVPFLPSLNLKKLFKRNGTRRLTNNSRAADRSLKNVLAPSFSPI